MKEKNRVLMPDAPDGLHALEYARHILEEELGWPAKGNHELLADCVTSVSKSRNLPLVKAHAYLSRAIRLAKEQGIEINRLWFMDGAYMNVRPMRRDNGYQKDSTAERAALVAEQATPEWQELSRKARETLAKLAGKVKMESVEPSAKRELQSHVKGTVRQGCS